MNSASKQNALAPPLGTSLQSLRSASVVNGVLPFIDLPAQLQGVALFSLAFQVYGATHFCWWGWNPLLREYPVSRVAPLSLLIPVFGIVGSMLLLGQYPATSEWLSIGLKKGMPVDARRETS